MQIREIIEHKYFSSRKKYAATIMKEKREFLYLFLQIKRETPKFQELIQDYGFIGRINTCGQEINKKIWTRREEGGSVVIRKKKKGGENLWLVEDQNFDSNRVRCSKHGLMSRFKFDYELMPWCWIID